MSNDKEMDLLNKIKFDFGGQLHLSAIVGSHILAFHIIEKLQFVVYIRVISQFSVFR